MSMTPWRNLITDVAGITIGQATDLRRSTGVTVAIFARPATASVDIRGGAPGTRDTDLLLPERTVQQVDALVLSGGSAFGLESAAGVMAWLAENGRGFPVGTARVPIVPGAILFDLLNGGDKEWGRYPPYREMGYEAARSAGPDFELGTRGAGTGATTATFKGGVGSASARSGTFTVGALVAVNALGSATIGDGPHFWAGAFEIGTEFGGLGLPDPFPPAALVPRIKDTAAQNTTIALVATDAVLTKSQARQMAAMAQDGMARALHPVHTPLDGDTVFAAATGLVPLEDQAMDLIAIGSAAAATLARAIARAVHEAEALPHEGAQRAWKDRWR